MASATEQLHARQGDTLDQLVWRERGFGPTDLPEILTLNPGLAATGTVLPLGTPVTVPVRIAVPATLAIVQLWD